MDDEQYDRAPFIIAVALSAAVNERNVEQVKTLLGAFEDPMEVVAMMMKATLAVGRGYYDCEPVPMPVARNAGDTPSECSRNLAALYDAALDGTEEEVARALGGCPDGHEGCWISKTAEAFQHLISGTAPRVRRAPDFIPDDLMGGPQ